MNAQANGNGAAAPASKRVAVVVGPGRSGTSALTGAMRALDVYLGDNLKRPLRKNAKGFFEDRDILDVNHRLLATVGLHPSGSSVGPIDPARWNDPAVAGLKAEAIKIIGERFGDAPLWGFKCGGMVRVLPFWEDVLETLGFEISYLIAIRNPLNMASSRGQLDIYRGAQEKSDAEWLAQVLPYFDLISARPFVVCDYDRMVEDAHREVWRIGRMLNIPETPEMDAQVRAYTSDFIEAKLRHHVASREDLAADTTINPMTRDAYLWLLRLACDEIDTSDPEFAADWARISRSFEEAGPFLRHIDFLEGELRRRMPPLKTIWGTVLQHLPVAATMGGAKSAESAKAAARNS